MKLKNFLLIMLCVLGILGCKSQSDFVSQADLKQKISASDKNYTLLDVRSSQEYSQGHIQGALHIPHTQVKQNLDKLDKNKQIIVYCQSGYRADKAIEILKQDGFTKVFHLQGDWAAWRP